MKRSRRGVLSPRRRRDCSRQRPKKDVATSSPPNASYTNAATDGSVSKDDTGPLVPRPLVPRNRLAMNAGRRPRADAASDALANLSNATLLRTSASVEANSTVGIDVGVDVGVKDAETTRGGGGDGGDKVGVRPDEVETTGVGLPASRASADQDQETDDDGDDDAVSSTESVRAANATSGTNAASASARTRRRWTRVTTTRVMVWRDETSFFSSRFSFVHSFVSPRMFRVRVRALACVVLVACATTSGALARGEGDDDGKWRSGTLDLTDGFREQGHARSLKQFLAPVRYSAVAYRDALYELGQALVDLALVRRQFEWVDLINDKHESGDYSYAYADYDDAGSL